MQAYRKDFSVSELAEGALPKQYIYTVAHASGSESSVLFPWLMLLLILISVKFRVNPWQIVCFLARPSLTLPA